MPKQSNSKKIYHPRTPVATFFKVLTIVVILLIILLVYIFFSFQKYIGYTADGQLYLDIPFLRFLYEDEEASNRQGLDGYELVYEVPSSNFPLL